MSKKNNSRRYLERDPFNPENEIECEISMDKNERYGMLTIHKINGEKCNQVIYGTPKLKYPFDANGNWHFPSAKTILSYEKYDGTNILMYRYRYKDILYTTYKVRLFPFLRGPILEMWKRCLDTYYKIPSLFSYYTGLTGVSFEMYGSDNPHLIEYNHDLDVRMLFGLKETTIVPLGEFNKHLRPMQDSHYRGISNVPIARLLNVYNKDYIYNYRNEQQAFEAKLQETENGFIGDEGSVWYLQDKNNKWHLFKCKPHQIEKIHWASYPIDANIIRATAFNVFEVHNEVTHKNLCELLLEDFPKQQIELSQERIKRILEEFAQKSELYWRVQKIMDEEIGYVSGSTIPDILRQLSKHFEKSEMSAVYQSLKQILT